MTKPSVLLANRPVPWPTITVLALLILSLIVVGMSLALDLEQRILLDGFTQSFDLLLMTAFSRSNSRKDVCLGRAFDLEFVSLELVSSRELTDHIT